METETREESEATAATLKYGRFGIMCQHLASRRNALLKLILTNCTQCHDLINPRRACAVRVTVVVLSFCLSVCLLPRFLLLRATRRPISDTNGFSAILALFLK